MVEARDDSEVGIGFLVKSDESFVDQSVGAKGHSVVRMIAMVRSNPI